MFAWGAHSAAANGCPCLLFCRQLHKLEAALHWHLQYGALQDASVLQLLMVQAAADGNAVIMSLLLPLFEKQGWLVSLFVRTARPCFFSLL